MTKIDKQFILELKTAILQSRYIAARLVNREQIILYFNIGRKISVTAKKMAWGSKVLEQISNELQNELPGLRGFSAGNLKKMRVFAEFWLNQKEFSSTVSNQILSKESPIGSTVSNQLLINSNSVVSEEFIDAFLSVGFSHQFLIASKSKSLNEAKFYIIKTISENWSYRNLKQQIDTNLFKQIGTLPNNFKISLSEDSYKKALKSFKDEYLLEYINIQDPDDEDEKLIENEIVRNIKKFILSLGNDFAFMGNQFRLIVEEKEYFIDLLFFNRTLKCLVAFELKAGVFKPEYLGKLNFYLSVLDDTVRHNDENPSIGIILCKEKNNKIVEYSFRDFNKAMGVSTYKTSNELPKKYKNVLPSTETLKKLME